MKKLTFTVTLTFESKISDDKEIQEVAQNIASALKYQSHSYGLAPENSETFTEEITVTPTTSSITEMIRL